MRGPNDPYLGALAYIDNLLGPAYHVVKEVQENLDAINSVAVAIGDLGAFETVAEAATAAQTAETNAETAATTATTKATEAATSAIAAATAKTGAETAQTAAAASATTAETHKNSAATSATNAATSATSASGSATTATTKASEASTSATNAATSATSAAGSATTATTKAGEASASATAAAGSATTAGTHAGTATTKASEAATSATNAATSATTAAGSATAAAISANNASTSADDAATAQAAAEAAFDSFDDRYLGAKASNPTLDNDGNALITGALYFNTTAGEMRVYSGSAWLIAYNPAEGAVTSVGLTAPTGFSVSGTPITTSGDLGLAFAAGYSLPTDANQANWTTAYGWGNHASAGYLTSITGQSINSLSDVTITALGDSEILFSSGGSFINQTLAEAGIATIANPTFTGNPAAPTQTAGTNNTTIATTAFVQAAIAALIDTAPGTMDTLNELAAALGDDPNYAATVTTALAAKLAIVDIDDVPVNGETSAPISSNWAFDHSATTSGAHGISAFGATLVDDADAATARTTLGAVGLSDTQTLTNKTMTAPVINDASVTEPARRPIYTITDGASVSLDPANGAVQKWTLGASRTAAAPATWDEGQEIILLIDDGSAYTLNLASVCTTWRTNGGVAPTLNTTGYTEISLIKQDGVIVGARIGNA